MREIKFVLERSKFGILFWETVLRQNEQKMRVMCKNEKFFNCFEVIMKKILNV